MKKLSDIEIIESVVKGNINDYTLLINRYKDRAFSLLKRLLKNEMDAEEVLQDCFLKSFHSLNRIVYNSALSFLSSKKRKIEKEMSSFDEEYNLSAFDSEIYSTTENVSDYLFKMVDKLPIKNALVIILFYMDGLSLIEISNVMGISIVNVKVLLHRSRNNLRDLLIKHNYQEEMI